LVSPVFTDERIQPHHQPSPEGIALLGGKTAGEGDVLLGPGTSKVAIQIFILLLVKKIGKGILGIAKKPSKILNDGR